MTESEERAAFDAAHVDVVEEIVVLTDSSTGGAGKVGGQLLWTASADVIGQVSSDGAFSAESLRLEWLARDDQRGTWIHDLQPLTQYRVLVRRGRPISAEGAQAYVADGLPVPDLTRRVALVEVIERDMDLPALTERRGAYTAPLVIEDPLGSFTLDRRYGHVTGGIDWLGTPVSVSLDIDEDSGEGRETAQAALGTLGSLVADAAAVDSRWRGYIADQLTELANDWQDDNDEIPEDAPRLTPDDVARRVRLGELSISSDGSLTPYFDDDDLFWGHVILIDIEPDGTMTDAYIAG